MTLTKKLTAEFIGTFWLVLGGVAVLFLRLLFLMWALGYWVFLWHLDFTV